MKLYSNIIGNPVPRPNWNQTDSTAADFIKNKPNIAAIEEMAENALPKTGGTVAGNLSVGSTDDTTQRNFYVRRLLNGVQKSFRIYWGENGVLRLQASSGGTTKNYMDLNEGSTDFKQPVSIASGGTDANNAADALTNLGGLSKAGGTMTGAIDMGSKKITNLDTPTNSGDAANKSYVDSKRLSGTVSLGTTWTNKEQEVAVSGILATDMPHWGIVYGTNKEAEKEAFALIDELETQAGKLVFRCFGDVPTLALTIQWEVNR